MKPQLAMSLNQAIEYFQAGNLNGAELILKRVIQVDSKCLPALHILGLIKASQGLHKEAALLLKKAVRLSPEDASLQYNLAKALSESGENLESIPYHKKAIELGSGNQEAFLNYGKSLSKLGRLHDALAIYDKALLINAFHEGILLNKGASLKELGRYEDALHCANLALSSNPALVEALQNKGIVLKGLKRYEEALMAYDKALEINPAYAEAWSNKGNVLGDLKRYEEALMAYDKALEINPAYAEAWYNRGISFNGLHCFAEALHSYDKALEINPAYAEAWSNKGNVLGDLKRYEEALMAYDKALEINPAYAEAWYNRGVSFNGLHCFAEALHSYDKALEINPAYAEAWYNRGISLNELRHYEEAISSFERASQIKLDIPYLLGQLLYTRMLCANWDQLASKIQLLIAKIQSCEKVVTPFICLSLVDSSEIHLSAAQTWIKDLYPEKKLTSLNKKQRHEKIRIGYFSTDFGNHPVSHLTTELFEIHDRNKFEVYAFSFGNHQDDPLLTRIKKSFDHFIDVENKSDQQIAELSRGHGIDIAIDLGGHTKGARTGIFAYRAAPIQVNYLGYPGTMGTEYIDYIIADETIIPKENHQFYTEKIAHLPNSYMVDDSKRVASNQSPSRGDVGLPKDAFVFCCFNNENKVSQQVLESWSRILLKVKNSVLWIPENNEYFASSIRAKFEDLGVDPAHIFFAKRVELMADHLARYSCADLFLDTFQYNAHSTAVDSLKAGIPVITLIGQSFARRVGASLLRAIDLPELITRSQEEYESLAIELATNSEKLKELKERLKSNLTTKPLFNTPLFARHIEAAYTKIYERYQANLDPDHIYIRQ